MVSFAGAVRSWVPSFSIKDQTQGGNWGWLCGNSLKGLGWCNHNEGISCKKSQPSLEISHHCFGGWEEEGPATVAFFLCAGSQAVGHDLHRLQEWSWAAVAGCGAHASSHHPPRLLLSSLKPPPLSCFQGHKSHHHLSLGKRLPNGEELPNLNTYYQRDKRWHSLRKRWQASLLKAALAPKILNPNKLCKGSLPHIYRPLRLINNCCLKLQNRRNTIKWRSRGTTLKDQDNWTNNKKHYWKE